MPLPKVLVNSEGGTEGTLYALLQKCVTPFGKRLFRVWLCHPLRDTGAINARLDAVEEIMNHPTFLGDFKKLSRGLPDLERLISRIHASNCKVDEFMRVLDVSLPLPLPASKADSEADIGLFTTAGLYCGPARPD